MAQYFEPSTDTDANFANSVSGQTNSFFLPSVYSKKVLNFFRKASVVEAITNTDYAGEISSFGDSVKIIKEPVISVSDYTRNTDTTQTKLTDQEITLVVDSAKAFKFIVDDIETNMSHVNFKEVASSSAAYALKDSYDAAVIATMFSGVSSSSPDHVLGADNATDLGAGVYDGTGNIDLGVSGETDPLDLLARMARLLDEQNVPEEGRWFVAAPEWYDALANTSSKLLSVDYNAGKGSLRNGLVASGLVRGFQMYKSNNCKTHDLSGATPAGSATQPCAVWGQMSGISCGSSLKIVESLRSTSTFADIVRGLLVFGRKVLRTEAIGRTIYVLD